MFTSIYKQAIEITLENRQIVRVKKKELGFVRAMKINGPHIVVCFNTAFPFGIFQAIRKYRKKKPKK